MSNSLPPHGLQPTRLPCPLPSPGTCSNSCSLIQWYHLTISFSVASFSSCLQSFPASESFPISQLFTSGGQSTGALASPLPMNIQCWFPLGLTGLISLLSKGLSRVFSVPQFENINSSALSLLYGPTLTSVMSPSHQEACTNLLSSSIRGQTEEERTTMPWPLGWKPLLQKTNQTDHMDHNLV